MGRAGFDGRGSACPVHPGRPRVGQGGGVAGRSPGRSTDDAVLDQPRATSRPAARGDPPMSYLSRFLEIGGFLPEGADRTDGTPCMRVVSSVLSVGSGTDTE